ncbi:hypothetical protein ACWDAZ_40260, partial [Streptomyces sp. NPDC001215]
MTQTEEASGWDAIDAALAPFYPGITPFHVGYFPPKGFEGGALQGCSAYPAEGHWHYVTYGLSELYTPGEDDDPDWSGWGFDPAGPGARRRRGRALLDGPRGHPAARSPRPAR